jgi:hypothetical protein
MALDSDGKFASSPEQFGEWFGRVTPQNVRPALVVCSDFPCAIGKDGNLYFAYMHSLKIMRRTPDGAESVLVQPEQFGVDAAPPYGVTGITCGPDGKLYLFSLNDDSGNHGIYTVAMDGTIRTSLRTLSRIRSRNPNGIRKRSLNTVAVWRLTKKEMS